jgi:hypothetical protein
MVICHFLKSTVKDNINWLLVFKNSIRMGFLSFGPTRKLFLAEGKKKLDPLVIDYPDNKIHRISRCGEFSSAVVCWTSILWNNIHVQRRNQQKHS